MNLKSRLILPFTRAELPRHDELMQWAGVDWRVGLKADWKALPPAVVRGKEHGYLMKLDRSDWCQRLTYFTGRYYEFGVLRAMEAVLRPGDAFVDIGANIGMLTLHARHLVGTAGYIDCFEPNPACVDAIREHLAMNGITNATVHPCALAATPGTMTLRLTSEHSGTATLTDVGSAAVREIPVELRVGDDEIASAPRLIKIDVEGFEMQVLQGLTRTIEEHRPFLILELIDSHLSRAGTSAAEVSEFLLTRGYRAFVIGKRRRHFRHHLTLRPLQKDGSGQPPDVLWVHKEVASVQGDLVSVNV
jgi:FkbM family methyltransferase